MSVHDHAASVFSQVFENGQMLYNLWWRAYLNYQVIFMIQCSFLHANTFHVLNKYFLHFICLSFFLQGIHAVNLGDSGFIVVRDGCTIFRSPVQQHDFNFTYQLESGNGSDLPSAAQVS